MPNFVNNTITINGEGQIAAALAKKLLTITRVQVGTGVANTALPSLTGLVSPIMNLTPVPPQVSANLLQTGEVVVMAVLDTANVITTFPLTELGVFATSAGGPEQMIAYCQCSAPYDTIAPGSGSNRLILNLQVPIVVGIGASVSITVQAGNPVYVPPVVAGPGIIVTAPTDTSGRIIEWIVSTPQIVQNTTLYVNNSYTQNIAPYFSSLQNALNYLGGFSIASGVGVSINMAGQQFNHTAPIWMNHVNSAQITIQGVNNPDVSFNGIGAITGSAGNWRVQLLNVSSTANIKVGTWLNIYTVSFQWFSPLVGGTYQVTAVSGSTVTIANYFYRTSWPTMAGTSGTMTPLSTVIYMANSQMQYGLAFFNGIGLLQYIAIVMSGYATNYPAIGVLLNKGSGVFKNLGAYGMVGNTNLAGAYSVSGAYADFQNCSASNCDEGFTSAGAGSNLVYQGCCSTHNFRGLWAQGNANITFCPGLGGTANYMAGNRERGMLVNDASYTTNVGEYIGGQVVFSPILSSYNASYGVHFMNQSRCTFNPQAPLFAAYNTTYDVAATLLSCVNGTSAIQGDRRFNGTPGVLMPDGSYFN